ncbi:SWIM-type domain-containing protein [Abeliophyllum distichum]|uniref:SWIM-type domain-containing protein n=1 Tax=Abeliophyllum distichum TaxID=126358 RepID=A0ABD1UPU3_9LAMI
MLFIDGTFLKGRFKCILLSTTAKNGNQGLHLLAYAVVDSENYDNWLWFLEHLRSIVQSTRELTFVSDQNVGLMEALPKAFPTSNHFFCLQHLKGNLRDKVSGGGFSNNYRERMVWLFQEYAHSPTIALFNQKLEWQLNGFPCVHAVAAINRSGRCIDEFVDYYFHVAAFGKSYEEAIHPIPTSTRLEYENSANFDILPPPTKRQPGRPKKRQIRSRGEQVRMIRCRKCEKLDNHNKKSCKETLA